MPTSLFFQSSQNVTKRFGDSYSLAPQSEFSTQDRRA